jgi:hypothetical protein
MKRVLTLAVTAAILVLSACGGGKPTRASYARALNHVCATANATIKNWGSKRTIGGAEALFADVRHGRIRATRAELEDLYRATVASFGKITSPAGEARVARQFLSTAMQLRAALKRAFDLADSGNESAFADADRELSFLGTQADGLARRLDARSCG